MKVYGPYLFNSGKCAGRRYVVLRWNGKRRLLLYSRWLMEQKLGRQLAPSEEVDHIDDDKTNDDIDNLQVLTRPENVKKYRAANPAETYSFVCPQCNTLTEKDARHVKHNRKQGKARSAAKTAHGDGASRKRVYPNGRGSRLKPGAVRVRISRRAPSWKHARAVRDAVANRKSSATTRTFDPCCFRHL